eukprot:GILK01010352.1.p1 GENE.GILK01010352.1~~GILK01010352.1.p1  ORF type:complete len:418 (-),score=56.45 GILK01010352.1:162-1415(-)
MAASVGEDRSAEEVEEQADKSNIQDMSSLLTEDNAMQGDMRLTAMPELQSEWRIIQEIGRGTFSIVYHAESLCFRNHFVALKRIRATSSASRILSEVRTLSILGGKGNVSALYGGLRSGSFITLVMQHFQHSRFEEYCKTLTLNELRLYTYKLFESLAFIHSKHFIHRDIKPSNFLFRRDAVAPAAMLIDFGLAEQEHRVRPTAGKRSLDASSVGKSNNDAQSKRFKPATIPVAAQTVIRTGRTVSQESAGSLLKRRRLSPDAARAGTRGFRAPEVLLRVKEQTAAIDVWSAGVILLSIVTQRYPFFQADSPNKMHADLLALQEIATVVGSEALQESAEAQGRLLMLPEHRDPCDFAALCQAADSSRGYPIPVELMDLIKQCFIVDPRNRITSAEALKHPFIAAVPQTHPHIVAPTD